MDSQTHNTLPEDILAMFEGVQDTKDVLAQMKAKSISLDSDSGFVAGYLKAQFVEDICAMMDEQHLNRNQLAKKLGKSRQYVTKILNENANFTLETLAEIACALDMHVSVRMFTPDQRMVIVPTVKQNITSYPNYNQYKYKKEKTVISGVHGEENAGHIAA